MLSIRTQNRMALVPYNNVILIQDDYIDWETTEKNAIILNKVKLGTYSTKERALEVLDDIEFWCQETNQVLKHKNIYQMPKE